MNLTLRRGVPTDAKECGRIVSEAFKSIAGKHNFPQDFPTPEVGAMLMSFLLTHPKFYSTVAELDGRIIGSNFLMSVLRLPGLGLFRSIPLYRVKAMVAF